MRYLEKTIQNNRIHVFLTTNEKTRKKPASLPRFKDVKNIFGNLQMFAIMKNKAEMDKPIYIGQIILDSIKILTYFYDYMVLKYGKKIYNFVTWILIAWSPKYSGGFTGRQG